MRVLNVGGGSKATPIPARYEGWDHVLLDIAPAPDVDVVCDAREMPSYLTETCDAVYCAHNLEHYYAHDVPVVLGQMRRMLKRTFEGVQLGGEVHIIVPNIGQLIVEMAERDIDLDDVLYQSPAGPITPLDVFYGYGREIAESGQDFYAHKTGFTAARLHRVLVAAGFKEVKVVANLAALELEGIGRA